MPALTVETRLGAFTVTQRKDTIVSLTWGGRGEDETPLLREAGRQLEAYAEGRLTDFDLPLNPEGGALGQAVMAAMRAIPYGETRTYGAIAAGVGAPAQAVGQACGANPVPVIIPCHRVVGANGLGGFSAPGGVDAKVALLRHEGAYGLLI